MSFAQYLAESPIEEFSRRVHSASLADVARVLDAPSVDFQGFLTLLSPAAASYLEPMAQKARAITRGRFGHAIQMYAPVYASNECTNSCLYCGFHRDNAIRRATLSLDQLEAEAEILWLEGLRSLLLVSGEAPDVVPPSYFEEAALRLHPRFPSLAVEVYPLSTPEYVGLTRAGVDGLTLYQETYDPALYARMHPGGRKADYGWRLDAVSRGAEAGMRRVGIGALLGLGPWRREAVALGLHALWLQKKHWQTQVCVSFPRVRKAPGGFTPPLPVADSELAQLVCALRLLLPGAGLVLSTREPPNLRAGLAHICITHMSAGSRTEPGGYTRPGTTDRPFSVLDRRSPAEVAGTLLASGLNPIWKDWDTAFTAPAPATAERMGSCYPNPASGAPHGSLEGIAPHACSA